MTTEDVPNLETALPPGIPDDWVYDHDLPCPNCGYNLRMRRTPRCPECGSGYTWQFLLNVSCMRCGTPLAREAGERCPRCDLALDWAALIDGVNPQSLRIFEYAPNPVRSAFTVFRQAFAPWRFWKRQVLEMKPNTKRLRTLIVWVLAFYGIVCVLEFILPLFLLPVSFAAGLVSSDSVITLDVAGTLIAVWLPFTTFAMLPCFGPTLRLCRLRRDQVLRIAAYGLTGIFWATVVCFGLLCVAVSYNLYIYFSGGQQGPIYLATHLAHHGSNMIFFWGLNRWAEMLSLCSVWTYTLFQTVWWWPFLWFALRRFLRLKFRDALALFLSTQIIGLLIMVVLFLQLVVLT